MSNYQSLFVPTRDQPHADLLKEVFSRGKADPEPNTWCGESILAYRRDEVLFLYWSVSGITHRRGDGEKAENKYRFHVCGGLVRLITASLDHIRKSFSIH